jgi:hypothetical protein
MSEGQIDRDRRQVQEFSGFVSFDLPTRPDQEVMLTGFSSIKFERRFIRHV